MRLLLAKDRLSTLDHEGSDQPVQRPKMLHTKSNQLKKKLNGYPAVTLRRSCAGPAQGPAQGAGSSGPVASAVFSIFFL
eukprot:scaffold2549_cov108-Isochrysis_galbana.AAC.2